MEMAKRKVKFKRNKEQITEFKQNSEIHENKGQVMKKGE